jgi:hypothetical protein
VEVPGSGGLVLPAAPIGRQFRLVPGTAANDLDGLPQGQHPGLEQVVEVGELRQGDVADVGAS